MEANTTKRRPRNAPRSTEGTLTPKARAIATFAAIHERGPLPTPYLFEYVKHLSGSLGSFKNLLTDLYHEENTEHGGRYLRRLAEHPNLPDYCRFAIYENTRFAEHALEEAGYDLVPRSYDWEFDPHRFMVSCTGASIEIAARENRLLSYKGRSAILLASPTGSMKIPSSIRYNGHASKRSLIPDDLFGLEYIGDPSYFRLFAVECDRGNEPYERADLDQTSLHAKFLRYKHVREGDVYKKHFGRKCGLSVLFIFTTTSKMEGFMEHVLKWNDGPCDWILCKVAPAFGKALSVPPVMRELLTTPWQRPGRAEANISKVSGW